MTNLNSEDRELTNDELNVVSGGGPSGWWGVVWNLVTDAVKGEANGEGFVAQASNAAKQRL